MAQGHHSITVEHTLYLPPLCCVYIHIYIYIYKCIYIYVCMYVCVCVHVCVCLLLTNIVWYGVSSNSGSLNSSFSVSLSLNSSWNTNGKDSCFLTYFLYPTLSISVYTLPGWNVRRLAFSLIQRVIKTLHPYTHALVHIRVIYKNCYHSCKLA